MSSHKISIVHNPKNHNGISDSLATQTFNAFKPFVNVFDSGVRADDGTPIHTITKEDWQVRHQYKLVGSAHYPDGRKFHPWKDVARHVYSADHVQKCFDDGEIQYYTSGKHGLGLLYGDIDAHHEWQDDEQQALDALLTLFPDCYHRPSLRGQNALIKVRYDRWDDFNKVAGLLEKQVRLLFLSLGIKCDFEVKGTITTKDKSGALAKLPFMQRNPCHQRSEHDSWNFHQLRRFERSPILNVARVEHIANTIVVDLEKVEATTEIKRILKLQNEEQQGTMLGADAPNMQQVRKAEPVDITPVACRQVKRSNNTSSIMDEPNAHSRRWMVVDLLSAQLKRMPTVDEVEQYIMVNDLYSAPWHNPKRRKDIAGIIAHRSKTFDPTKIKSGSPNWLSELKQSVWGYRRWARSECPKGWTDTPNKTLDEFGDVVSRKQIKATVRRDHVCVGMAILASCLKKNPDGSIPEDWIQERWEALHKIGEAPKWSARKWRIIKKEIDRRKIVVCDFIHFVGRANRYEAGEQFVRLRRNTTPSSIPTSTNNTHIPNTLENTPVALEAFFDEKAELRGRPPNSS